ncbi:MAG: NAD(P)-binding domain-containing protein [Gammaproteobacteria bacterium]|nr:NAD(P)-binding domain-containing protein [Gammaproteobacteria bacterium]
MNRIMRTIPNFRGQPANSSYFLHTRNGFFRTVTNNVFVRLPVLDIMVDRLRRIEESPLCDTAVVYVHHPLRTSLNLLDSMFSIGLDPKNTFVLGKHYSENEWVVQETQRLGVHYQRCSAQTVLGGFDETFSFDINSLWETVVEDLDKKINIKNLLVLDHGGYAINFMPSSIQGRMNIVGLEKTSGGLINLVRQGCIPSFPLINMANCATKKVLESPLIAEAVVEKLSPVIPVSREPTTCGVIGYGSIGKAIAEKLLSLGHRVIIYDSDSSQLQSANLRKNFVSTSDLVSLVASADLLFGCSGQDVTKSVEAFRLSPRDKTLVSCSSGDREFLTLLKLVQKNNTSGIAANPLDNVVYESDFGGKIKILRGGFPYNFDDTGESVPANEIQLTRALVFAGVIQAIDFFKNPTVVGKEGLYALDSGLQKFVVREWLKLQPEDKLKNRYQPNQLSKFEDTDWIGEHSAGIQEPINFTLETGANLKFY